jgi:hypothetical protein
LVAHEVFVSYSSKDKTIADAVVATLENNGIRCWYAPRDIRSGDDWGNAITNAVEGAQLFLLIFSGHSNQSQRVLDELNLAISCEIPIIPFRIENLEPAGAMRLHLTSRHWLDAFDPSWESNLQKLIHTVSTTLDIGLGAEDIQLPDAGPRVRSGKGGKRIPRIAAGAVAAAVLIFAGWYGLTRLIPGGDDQASGPPSDPAGVAETTEVSSASDPNPLPPDWGTPEFVTPGNGLWKEEAGKYTAIGSQETTAWSEMAYSGDIEISLDIESSNAFAAANIIVYGNGLTISPSNVIFTVASDILAIVEGTIYNESDYSYSSFPALNFVEEKHTVLIQIIDRKATLSVDGEKISSVFLQEATANQGKIGLLKYWEIDEITFSNIRVRGTELTQ